jgi:hypothetical protein
MDYKLNRLAKLAGRMDAIFTIPNTRIPVGLDNILGLIPVIGDTAAFVPSAYLVYRAHKIGASNGTVVLMVGNLLMDLVIGSIPIIGDIFDVLYNANLRNYALLEQNLNKKAARAKLVRTAFEIERTVA